MKGVATDYLHCLLLGVSKTLIEFWFDKKNRRERFYIGKKVNLYSGLSE